MLSVSKCAARDAHSPRQMQWLVHPLLSTYIPLSIRPTDQRSNTEKDRNTLASFICSQTTSHCVSVFVCNSELHTWQVNLMATVFSLNRECHVHVHSNLVLEKPYSIAHIVSTYNSQMHRPHWHELWNRARAHTRPSTPTIQFCMKLWMNFPCKLLVFVLKWMLHAHVLRSFQIFGVEITCSENINKLMSTYMLQIGHQLTYVENFFFASDL